MRIRPDAVVPFTPRGTKGNAGDTAIMLPWVASAVELARFLMEAMRPWAAAQYNQCQSQRIILRYGYDSDKDDQLGVREYFTQAQADRLSEFFDKYQICRAGAWQRCRKYTPNFSTLKNNALLVMVIFATCGASIRCRTRRPTAALAINNRCETNDL